MPRLVRGLAVLAALSFVFRKARFARRQHLAGNAYGTRFHRFADNRAPIQV